MSAIWKIEEDGTEVASLAAPENTFYLLDNDHLLVPQSEIGYCNGCSTYTWVENLNPPENSDLGIDDLIEWHKHLRQFLKTRTEPPRCLHCQALDIVRLGFDSMDGVNPVTRRKHAFSIAGTACFLEVPPLFLRPDGTRIDLPDDKAIELSKRGRGYFYS